MAENKTVLFSDDFEELVREHQYIDKSMFIEDFVNPGHSVYMFIRPEGFGKSVNLSMLKSFFEISDTDTSEYFKDLKIWNKNWSGKRDEIRATQGKRPVIYLKFKEAACPTYEETAKKIAEIISGEFVRHAELKDSPAKDVSIYGNFEKIAEGRADISSYNVSTAALGQMLYAHYNERPYFLVDDYDAPLMAGKKYGYYDEIYSFVFKLYDSALMSCRVGIFMGKEYYKMGERFDQFDNGSVNHGCDRRNEYFAFNEYEVRAVLKTFDLEDKFEEANSWYGRFLAGSREELFSPVSVMKYVYEKAVAKRYREKLSDATIIDNLLSGGNWDIMIKFSRLMSEKNELEFGRRSIPVFKVSSNKKLHIRMFDEGYLTNLYFDKDDNSSVLAVPNREAMEAIFDGISFYFWGTDTDSVKKSIAGGKVAEIRGIFSRIAEKLFQYDPSLTPLCYDVVTALSAAVSDIYSITTDFVKGKNPSSVTLSPKTPGDGLRNTVFAISVCENSGSLKKAAKVAKRQRERDKVVDSVIYGVAVCGKDVYVV